MIYVYRVNTGSCGGCDVEICAAVEAHQHLAWAATVQDADVVVMTGPITPTSRAALFRLIRDAGDRPLLAIGRCAIDGHPFGKGGVQHVSEVVAHAQLDGCPPAPEAIAEVIGSGQYVRENQ
jgi:membrane-bound hydrogenase subunit mbhJ